MRRKMLKLGLIVGLLISALFIGGCVPVAPEGAEENLTGR